MTSLPDFISLTIEAEKTYANPTEAAVDEFMSLFNSYPPPTTVIEKAMLEVIEELVVHQYICSGTHSHKQNT